MGGGVSNRTPLSPKEAWLSDGRQVLHFRLGRWDRWNQQLEVSVGELLPNQPVPLLKSRLQLSREEARKLWAEKRQQGSAADHGPVASAPAASTWAQLRRSEGLLGLSG